MKIYRIGIFVLITVSGIIKIKGAGENQAVQQQPSWFQKKAGDFFAGASLVAMQSDKTAQAAKLTGQRIQEHFLTPFKNESTSFLEAFKEKSKNLLHDVKGTGKESSKMFIMSAAAIMALWVGYKILWATIEKKLKEPAINFSRPDTGFIASVRNWFWPPQKIECRTMWFDDKTTDDLMGVLRATSETAQSIKAGDPQARYRHLFVSGPAGSGKTMYAKQFAYELFNQVGMSYIFLDGSFFAPSKNDAALQRVELLFQRAQQAPHGALIFIDHAELLFSSRVTCDANNEWHQITTKFLSYLKESSRKYMVVFATNKEVSLDQEIKGLIYDIKIGLPKQPERVKILNQYKEMLLLDPKINTETFINSVKLHLHDDRINQIATSLEGISCRELENIVQIIRQDARSQEGIVTEDIITKVIEQLKQKYPELGKNPQVGSVQAA